MLVQQLKGNISWYCTDLLYMLCVFLCLFRNPHHDVNVQWSACLRIHSFCPTNRSLPLPWTLLWRSLYLGGLPPTALRETVGAEDEQRLPGWLVPKRESNLTRVQVSEMPWTKESLPSLHIRVTLLLKQCAIRCYCHTNKQEEEEVNTWKMDPRSTWFWVDTLEVEGTKNVSCLCGLGIYYCFCKVSHFFLKKLYLLRAAIYSGGRRTSEYLGMGVCRITSIIYSPHRPDCIC